MSLVSIDRFERLEYIIPEIHIDTWQSVLSTLCVYSLPEVHAHGIIYLSLITNQSRRHSHAGRPRLEKSECSSCMEIKD